MSLPRTSLHKSHLSRPSIEPLESRIAPALAVSLTGALPNFTVVFNDDASGKIDNSLEIRLNGSSELEFSLNGGAFTNDLDSTTAGTQSATVANLLSIAVNLGTDRDTLTISHSGGLVNPHGPLTFDGGPGGSNTFTVNGTGGADTIALVSGSITLNGRAHDFDNVDHVTVAGGAGTDALTIGATSLAGGLTTNAETMAVNGSVITGGDILLVSDALDVQGTLNAGFNSVTIQPVTAGRAVNLGTENAAQLSITDGELDKMTARVIKIGDLTTGALSVSTAITPAGTNTLTLTTGTGITETGTIAVTNLRIESAGSATLTGVNDIGVLAANISAAAGSFSFRDANSFAAGTVDGTSGIHVSSVNAANVITLNLGAFSAGSMTQFPGANLTGPQLELLGAGSYTLANSGNDVDVIAARSGLTFTDVNGLTVGTAGATAGVRAGVSDTGIVSELLTVTLRTLDGDLVIANTAGARDLAASQLELIAQSTASQDRAIMIAAGAVVSAFGNFPTELVADHVFLDGSINDSNGTTRITPFTPGTIIDLGGADAPNTLGLTNAELNAITTGTLQIGAPAMGTVRVTAPVGGAHFRTLTLDGGAGFYEIGPASVTQTYLVIQGSGDVVFDGANQVANLKAIVTGGVVFSEAPGQTLTLGTLFGGNQGIGSGGDVTLKADAISIGSILATGTVTLQPVSAGVPISLGSEIVGSLSFSTSELGAMQGSALQIGGNQSGSISVNSALDFSATVDFPAMPTLALLSGGSIGGSGTIKVQNLRLQSVGSAALPGNNDVNTLAATVSGPGQTLTFADIDDLTIGSVAGGAGLQVSNAPSSAIALNASATTQSAGAPIVGANLVLAGGGPFTLEEPGNEVGALSATITGALAFTNAHSLTLGTGNAGVVTTNALIRIATVDGGLSISDRLAGDDVSAGSSTVTLTAGGQNRALTLSANAGVTATRGVTLVADQMSLSATINAGTATAALRPFTNAAIDLGGSDSAGTLGLSVSEIGAITAGTLRIGESSGAIQTGAIHLTQPLAPNAATLHLTTGALGAGISGAQPITVARLRLDAHGAIALDGSNDVDTLAAQSGTGGLTFTDVDGFAFGDVNGSSTTIFAGLASILPGTGPLIFNAPASLLIKIDGSTAGTGYDQLTVTGAVNLGGATVGLVVGYVPGANDRFTIVSNDGTDPVVGTFAGLAEGALITQGGEDFKISYVGGDGNDVVLAPVPRVTLVQPVISHAGKVATFTDTDGIA